MRPLLHELATHDDNQAVRRLAVLCLDNGSPQRETILLLSSIADDDEQDKELRAAASKIGERLRKKGACALGARRQLQGVRPQDGQVRRRFQTSRLLPTPLMTIR